MQIVKNNAIQAPPIAKDTEIVCSTCDSVLLINQEDVNEVFECCHQKIRI